MTKHNILCQFAKKIQFCINLMTIKWVKYILQYLCRTIDTSIFYSKRIKPMQILVIFQIYVIIYLSHGIYLPIVVYDIIKID